MRRLIWAGLGLALGCLTAYSWAEEIQFRPTGQSSPTSAAKAVPTNLAISGKSQFDPSVLPTSFTQGGSVPVQFRAKTEESQPPPLPPEPLAVPLPPEPVSLPTGIATKEEPKKKDIGEEISKSEVKKNGPPETAPKSASANKGVLADESPKAESKKTQFIEETQKGDPQKPEVLPKPMPKDKHTAEPGKNITIVETPGKMIYSGSMIPDDSCPEGEVGGACCSGTCCPDWLGWCRKKMAARCSSCDPCSLPLFYARGEYLFWGISRDHVPTLVTTTTLSPMDIFNLSQSRPVHPGGQGELGTVPLFGGEISNPDFSGGRFTVGLGDWLHCGWGLETTFFFLGDTARRFNFSSDGAGSPGLFSPFTDANGVGQSLFVAFPDQLKGNVSIEHNTRIWGIEANLRKPLLCDCNSRLDLLAGFRFIQLAENLNISRSNQCIVPGCGDETALINDSFGTRNRFYGGQVGVDYEYRHQRWIFGASGKLAIGDMLETIQINGGTVMTIAGTTFTSNNGLLAQDSNSGQHARDRFVVVPEVGLKVGYQVTENVTAFVGYTALYMSDVVRPGQQVDLVVDKSGNLQRPHVPFNGSGFWATGFNAGLEWKY